VGYNDEQNSQHPESRRPSSSKTVKQPNVGTFKNTNDNYPLLYKTPYQENPFLREKTRRHLLSSAGQSRKIPNWARVTILVNLLSTKSWW